MRWILKTGQQNSQPRASLNAFEIQLACPYYMEILETWHHPRLLTLFINLDVDRGCRVMKTRAGPSKFR